MMEEREDELAGTGFEDEKSVDMDELSFDEDDDEQVARAGDTRPDEALFGARRARSAGLTGGANPDHDPTNDDLTPENLIPDDGARSPREAGASNANDSALRPVRGDEAGLGKGLDEAELGRSNPLDGKPWDGPAP